MEIQLPEKIVSGSTSSLMISDIMRPRDTFDNEMFVEGQPTVGGYFVPPFQRPLVWTESQKRSLIESVFLGLSIGAVMVTETREMENGKYLPSADWVIDGQQRMNALEEYMYGDLQVFLGTPAEHRYNDLSPAQKRFFKQTPMGFITIKEANVDALRELYNRLNFSGTNHTEDQKA